MKYFLTNLAKEKIRVLHEKYVNVIMVRDLGCWRGGSVSNHGLRILEEALALPVNERADLVERLLSSLDAPEPEIAQLWPREVEDRIDAVDRGKLGAISAEEFFRPPSK